jgi:hypothetical protein
MEELKGARTHLSATHYATLQMADKSVPAPSN